ncbi:hypothetical protein BDN70DRAFT_984120 [Pholiota conissans]|uniref:Uncharacterized protein n=1 Tax=Pholiota conissans TaxID=109636 RepID=A0A9P6CTG0_9AGAR|nr:hypothetical protein BDN70DRAFT_984120 [Pholiota conissans]
MVVFPSGPTKAVRTFIENTVHFGVDGDEAEWEAMVPNKGMVYLEDPNDKNLKLFTVSIFHQLRCLDIIRKGIVDLEARHSRSPLDSETSLTALTHHCVNYLRQMVLCRSDLDLDTVFGSPKPAVYSDTYQCKDWEAIYRDVEKNQKAYRDSN